MYIKNYGQDDFEEMIRDWQADHAPEYDDLVIDEIQLDDNQKWVAYAHDDKTVYSIRDDGTGDIVLNYVGAR